jgi:Zn-dependent protease
MNLAYLIVFPCFIIAAVVHEVAHGYTAYKLGDPTAKQLGRISFNPIRHIDLFLTIIIPALLISAGSPIVIGGAKPVPVDPRFFTNPKFGMGLVAVAGPLVNFLMMFLTLVVAYLYSYLFSDTDYQLLDAALKSILTSFILINFVLGLFNLTPVPPLDGGRIVTSLLPTKLAIPFAKLERFGFFILILLLYSGVITPIIGGAVEYLGYNLLPEGF